MTHLLSVLCPNEFKSVRFLRVCTHEGKKQDVWFVVDPETGEKQTSLTTSTSESICPNTPLLYIGRTGILHTHTRAYTHLILFFMYFCLTMYGFCTWWLQST